MRISSFMWLALSLRVRRLDRVGGWIRVRMRDSDFDLNVFVLSCAA